MPECSTLGKGDQAFNGIPVLAAIERDGLLCYDPARYADAT